MIEFYKNTAQSAHSVAYKSEKNGTKALSFVKNERMAGRVASWDKPQNALQELEQKLSSASTQKTPAQMNRLSFHADMNHTRNNEKNFGFADILDIVNPLQHIPLVNIAYREITGDQIKSSTQIVGGALYGGFGGAAAGIANAIIREETGKDIAENALAFVRTGEKPTFKYAIQEKQDKLVQTGPTTPVQNKAYNDLPPALMTFADIQKDNVEIKYSNGTHNDSDKPAPSGLYALAENLKNA
ncbi:MAG: hypothetical protein KTR28_06315 [Micavibrio sp.]|nr:hypothetical protein [Micavibrio sp.]